jgi:Transglutaminase-like superfamily
MMTATWFGAFTLAQPGGDTDRVVAPETRGSGVKVSAAKNNASPKETGFWPQTEAERELEQMLKGEDRGIDLALANWLIAAEVPGFRSMTREAYFKQLDRMTEQVRREMAATKEKGGLESPMGRCGSFVDAMHRLGFAYAEEFRKEDLTPAQLQALYSDPDNIFLAGLIRARRGSCVSMPLIYLVIGQRLGLPVHLVTIGRHYFIRWEEPGFRMNIETTINDKACFTPDDSVYLDSEGMKPDDAKGSQLRNLTDREAVGELLFTRAGYWAVRGEKGKDQARSDLALAHRLAPDDPAVEAMFGRFSGAAPPLYLTPSKEAHNE